jgi:3-methyladenine DNA glycosylase/8-oxoguanine DNA glycosylase
MRSFTLETPADYRLARDVCSYGYFLLAPNYWDTRARVLWRVLRTADGSAVVRVSQEGTGPLRVACARALSKAEKTLIAAQLTRMLRLDEPRAALKDFHARDPGRRRSGAGRLFRSPTLFEDVIKTVTSCNVTWPSTVVMNRRLCEVVGLKAPAPALPKPPVCPDAHAFPTPEELATQRPARLRSLCRVGYRDARIVELARLFTLPPQRGGVDQERLQDPATPDDEIYEMLIELPGIGPYAAANIMQLLGRYRRLPLDTESVRHGRTVLGMKGTGPAVMRRVAGHYRAFGDQAFRAYWFDLWDFYQRKHGKAWTWERDSTGKLFTAAALKK